MQSDETKKQSTLRNCTYALDQVFRATLFENPVVGDMIYHSYLENLPTMVRYARANDIIPYEYVKSLSNLMQDEKYRYRQAQMAAAEMRRFRSYLHGLEK